jgi:hypothetical protein
MSTDAALRGEAQGEDLAHARRGAVLNSWPPASHSAGGKFIRQMTQVSFSSAVW